AVLSLLARLGLRGAEAAGLQLGDIDWRGGEIAVTGKGSRTERPPPPAPAGAGPAARLQPRRAPCAARAAFPAARPPYRPPPRLRARAARGGESRRGQAR